MPQKQIFAENAKNANKYLKIGDTVPDMKMEDINGKDRSNKEFSDRIIVYSFADRSSNKPHQSAIGPAAKRVVKAFPDI